MRVLPQDIVREKFYYDPATGMLLRRQALEALEDVFGKNKVDVGIINALKERLK